MPAFEGCGPMVQMDKAITEKHERALLQQTPNGVLLVDRDLCVRFANPAFRKMFKCAEKKLIGKPVGDFLDSNYFKDLIAAGEAMTVKADASEQAMSFRAGLFPIEGEDLYGGIFIDTSDEEAARKQYRELRAQTLERAQEVIARQMKTAQEIARLLGETTAETKVLLVKLMKLFEKEAEETGTQ